MLFIFPVCMHFQVGFCLNQDLQDFRIYRIRVAGCCGFAFIFSLFFISCFAGLLPVFSWVFGCKSLIINAIHFSGMHAFSGWFLWGEMGRNGIEGYICCNEL